MKSLIKTYTEEIYIIEGKNPNEIKEQIQGMDFISMPNGDEIRANQISMIMSYKSYRFQTDQKNRHRRGQFLHQGSWHDRTAKIANAHLEAITGDIKKIETKND